MTRIILIPMRNWTQSSLGTDEIRVKILFLSSIVGLALVLCRSVSRHISRCERFKSAHGEGRAANVNEQIVSLVKNIFFVLILFAFIRAFSALMGHALCGLD